MIFPKVSIQIPTYNQGKYIEQAIKSCLNQDYPNLEINIADDCSTDNTHEIIKPYLKDKKINYFKNEINIGRISNYRKALNEYATGIWVLNLDGDDYFTNNHFIKNAIEKILIEGCDDVLFYQGNHILKTFDKEFLLKPHLKEDFVIIIAKKYLNHFFTIKNFSHMSTLYNRRIAITLGFYEKDIISSDIYSFLNMAINHPGKKIILSNELSGVWLHHDLNISKSLKIKDHLKNFSLYTHLFFQQLKNQEFSDISSILWLFKAFYIYWRSWISSKFLIKWKTVNLKNILLQRNIKKIHLLMVILNMLIDLH